MIMNHAKGGEGLKEVSCDLTRQGAGGGGGDADL